MFTRFLIHRFVKNYPDTRNNDVRQAYGYLAGMTGLCINILLFSSKLAVGLLANSIAIMADSFNNLSDSASSIIALVGFKITNKPADRGHPFGHGRVEYISALIVAFMVILVGFEFVKSSVNRIINPEAVRFDYITIGVLTGSILLKLWLGRFYKQIGRAIESKIMEATALDSFSDVLTTSVVLVSVLITRWIKFPIDGYIGIVVAALIIYAGFTLTKETLNPLLGEAPEPELVNTIMDRTLAYEGILGVHDMVIHNYGPGRCIASLHAEIPGSMNIMRAHDIIDLAEKEISEELGIHLVMHMDPINMDDKEVRKAYGQALGIVEEFAAERSIELTIHDFRMVGTEGGVTNLIFDLVLPLEIAEKEEASVIEVLKRRISDHYPQYNAVITIDRHYSIFK